MAIALTCPTCGYTTTSKTRPLAEYGQRRHDCQVHLAKAARRNKAARERAQRPIRDCQHPIARHQHGTRAAYVLDKCRCLPCTDAIARYERQRGLERMDGIPAYVDTAPAVAHIKKLQAAGLGWKRIAHLAGIPTASVYPLLYGRSDRRDGKPRTQARPATVNAILAVPMPTLDDLGRSVPVDATGTRRRLQALQSLGWSLTQLAEHAGLANRHPLDHAMRQPTTGAGTARAVRDMYEGLWDQPPPKAVGRGPASAQARIRNHAKRQGWAPPLAWDDESIDDPDAQPVIGERPRVHGKPGVDLDEFMWLIGTGEHPERAAQRLGVRIDTISTAARRYDRTDVLAHTTSAAVTGTACATCGTARTCLACTAWSLTYPQRRKDTAA